MTKRMVPHAVGACLVAMVSTASVWAETAAAERKSPKPGQPLNADAISVAKGSAAFGLDLYAQLRAMDGNLAFSPYSISTALAMTYSGAGGQTAEQMARVLHFEPAKGKIPPAFADLAMSLYTAGKDTHGSLDIANALWGQQGEQFLIPFLANNNEFYGAGFKQLDFAKSIEQARQAINAWVAEKTKDKIKELLQKEDVDASTRLVLTNAVYFRADWVSQFAPKLTKDAPFWLDANRKVNVPMMHQDARFPVATVGDELSLIELPYVGKRLSLVVLLPRKKDGLSGLEKSLDADKLAGWIEQTKPTPVRVSLPKFKISTRFNLSKTLAAMGMADAFDAAAADFSGMNGKVHDLCISNVIHQTELEVFEQGTEAAAATAVTMKRDRRSEAEFTVDHPFLFVLRDRETGSILFMGRVVDPKS
ncbi:MAG: serpin family protein [Phycisphaerae bacterium]|nr:serpin family protein [Phycisphaerae bacterium]